MDYRLSLRECARSLGKLLRWGGRWRRALTWGLGCFSFLALPAQADVPVSEQWPQSDGVVRCWQIPEGPLVVQQEIPSSTVVGLAMLVPAGSRTDPAGQSGRAHLLEHLLYRATPHYDASKLALEWERLGARRGALTTPDYAMFWELVPAPNWSTALAIEADRLRSLTLDKDSLAAEKRALVYELRTLEANSLRRLKSAACRTLAPQVEEGQLFPQGRAADIANIDESSLREAYRRLYDPRQAIIAVVGGFNSDALKARLGDLFAAAPPREALLSTAEGAAERSSAEARPQEEDKGASPVAPVAPQAVEVLPAQGNSAAAAEGNAAKSSKNTGANGVGAGAAVAGAAGSAASNLVEVRSEEQVPGLVLYACQLPPRSAATYAVLESWLARGAASVWGRAFREQGWQYKVHLQEPERTERWATLAIGIDAEQEPQRVAAVAQDSLAQLERLVPGYPELEAARKRALSSFYDSWQEPQKRVQMLAAARYRGELEELLSFPRDVRSCSAQQVADLGRELFTRRPLARYVSAAGGNSPLSYGPGINEAYAGDELERQVLPNGVKLVIASEPNQPLVYLYGFISGGALDDPADKPGLTCFAAGLLGKGRDDLTHRSFGEELSERGMTLSFRGDNQGIIVQGSCLREDVNRWLDILCQALRHSHPDEGAVDEWRQEWCDKLRLRESVPENRATASLMANLYPQGHAFGRFYGGSSAEVERYTREEALTQLHRCVRPSRLTLCVSGGTSSAVVLRKLQSRLGDWVEEEGQVSPAVSQLVPRQQQEVQQTIYQPVQELLLVGQLGPGREDSDYDAFYLLNQILGGSSRLSRLPLRIEHMEHLGQGVTSRVLPLQGAAPWAAVMRLEPGKAERAVAIVKQELARLINPGPTQEEVERAKAALESELLLQMASPKSRVRLLGNLEQYSRSEDWLQEYREVYRPITPLQLRVVAKKWFDPAHLTVVVSRPE